MSSYIHTSYIYIYIYIYMIYIYIIYIYIYICVCVVCVCVYEGIGTLAQRLECSIPGRVIPKTLKMELDTTLLNTQHYKVRFKGKSGAILGME